MPVSLVYQGGTVGHSRWEDGVPSSEASDQERPYSVWYGGCRTWG